MAHKRCGWNAKEKWERVGATRTESMTQLGIYYSIQCVEIKLKNWDGILSNVLNKAVALINYGEALEFLSFFN